MKRQKGFTLIELMIVVAIIAILAALIVPNLMQNRIQANETSAMGSLRTYASAQATYQRGKFSQYTSAETGNAVLVPGSYADNYACLYYVHTDATATSAPIQLLNRTFADARRVLTGSTPTNLNGMTIGSAQPYQGYVFQEDGSLATQDDDYATNFGLIAFPSGHSTTGYNCFWIGIQGVILQQNIAPATVNGTPANPTANTPYPTGTDTAGNWIVAG